MDLMIPPPDVNYRKYCPFIHGYAIIHLDTGVAAE
jgi:hypothetical protein